MGGESGIAPGAALEAADASELPPFDCCSGEPGASCSSNGAMAMPAAFVSAPPAPRGTTKRTALGAFPPGTLSVIAARSSLTPAGGIAVHSGPDRVVALPSKETSNPAGWSPTAVRPTAEHGSSLTVVSPATCDADTGCGPPHQQTSPAPASQSVRFSSPPHCAA